MNASLTDRFSRRAPSAWRGALAAGVICLGILGGMLVRHAWPLWTGTSVVLPAVPVDPRDLFRGEFVRLSTPANSVVVLSGGEPMPERGTGVLTLRPVGRWWAAWPATTRAVVGETVYVQLEPDATAGQHRAVTISRAPLAGVLNLRGTVRAESYPPNLQIDFGFEAFYMEEKTALPIEEAIRAGRNVQMDVAVAADGRARIRNLIIDGTPLPRR